MPSQTDPKPYFFDVFYRIPVGSRDENDYMTQPHFATIREAADERNRLLADGPPIGSTDFEVSDIRGPQVIHHFVGMTESQKAIAQLKFGTVEAVTDQMEEEPF